jgi:AraC-like DNA-binding protein
VSAPADAAAWRVCHAGIAELIQPVRRAGRLEALLYIGPVRQPGPARRCELEAVAAMLAGWLRDVLVELDEGRACGGDSRLTRIDGYLAGHLAEDPDLDDLARHLGLSAERTRHLVRELTGSSFRALREAKRLAEAQRLLRIGFRPVQEIARACGCADAGWFGRWFRRRTGVTPLAWRRREQAV